jgi:probable phosphoglycerate mutase
VIPGAEPWEDFQGRCMAAVERIVEANRGRRIIAVVHGGVITAVLSSVSRSRNFAFVSADNTSLSEIVLLPEPIDRWVLRRFNDVTHLE